MKQGSSKGPLQELGLSAGAEELYRTLAEHAESDISDMARMAKQSRTDTYRYIAELLEHNLVRQILRGKRKLYEAVSPDAIFAILKKKEENIIDQVDSLQLIFDRKTQGFGAETYAGKEGLRTVFELLVKDAKKKANLLRIESLNEPHRHKKYYPRIYFQRVSLYHKGDMERYVITNPDMIKGRRKSLNRSIRAVPDTHLPFDFNFTSIIVEDKVAYIDYEHEKAFLIRNKRFAEYMTAIFWMLYEKL